MDAVDERRVAAVLGALVADAAAMPLHWTYDDDRLKAAIGDQEEVEFWDPIVNWYYRIAPGSLTCYGDQGLNALQSLVKHKGLDVAALVEETYAFFGPDSAYEPPKDTVVINKHGAPDEPINRPWRHSCLRAFLANVDAGKETTGAENDDQVDCVLRMVPVCALYAGRPDMLGKVEDVVRVTHDSDLAVAVATAAARILERFILHGGGGAGGDRGVLEAVLADLGRRDRRHPQDLDRAVAAQLRAVQAALDVDHHTAVTKKFRND